MVKAGYKQTEVGEIPEDWSINELSKIAKTGSGTTPPRARMDRYYGDGHHHWVKTLDLNNSLIEFTSEKITDLALKETSLRLYPKHSVLVAMYGGFNQIGRTGILNIPAAVNQAIIAIETEKDKLEPLYLLNFLNFKVDYWKGVASSSRKDPNITSRDVRSFKIHHPRCVHEQRSIAKALSDVSELITSLEKLISKKRDIKTATMQQLLTGKKRLPGFGEGTGVKKTELGEIPGDWDAARIGDSFDFKNGLNKAKRYFGHGTPIVNYMDVLSNYGIDKSIIAGKVHVSREEINNYSARKGDVFFTRTSETVDEIGIAASLVDDVPNAVFSGFILRAREKEGVECLSLEFKKYCFRSEVVRKQVRSTSSYTTRALTNGKLLSEVRFPRPRDIREQEEIARVIGNMEAEIALIEKRLDKTKAIKQGMMQELLTARTRLI